MGHELRILTRWTPSPVIARWAPENPVIHEVKLPLQIAENKSVTGVYNFTDRGGGISYHLYV